MIDVRCKNCNRLLMKALSVVAAVKCPSCKMVLEYQLHSNLSLTNAHDPQMAKEALVKKVVDEH